MNEEQFAALQRRYDALAVTVQTMEAALAEAADENRVLRAQLENADQNVLQQKTIVRQHLEQTAAKEAELVMEILDLRKQIKES